MCTWSGDIVAVSELVLLEDCGDESRVRGSEVVATLGHVKLRLRLGYKFEANIAVKGINLQRKPQPVATRYTIHLGSFGVWILFLDGISIMRMDSGLLVRA